MCDVHNGRCETQAALLNKAVVCMRRHTYSVIHIHTNAGTTITSLELSSHEDDLKIVIQLVNKFVNALTCCSLPTESTDEHFSETRTKYSKISFNFQCQICSWIIEDCWKRAMRPSLMIILLIFDRCSYSLIERLSNWLAFGNNWLKIISTLKSKLIWEHSWLACK